MGTIFVAEDDPMLRFGVVEWLRDVPMDVVEVQSGYDGLDYLPTKDPIDLNFSDVNRPAK